MFISKKKEEGGEEQRPKEKLQQDHTSGQNRLKNMLHVSEIQPSSLQQSISPVWHQRVN
jgi:hypothetical protein